MGEGEEEEEGFGFEFLLLLLLLLFSELFEFFEFLVKWPGKKA